MQSQSPSFPPPPATGPRRFCKKCGYSLFGLESRICPECGRIFDPANRRTFAARPPRGWLWRWTRRVVAVVLLLLLTAGAGVGWLWWGWHSEQPTIARLWWIDRTFTVAPIGPEWLRWMLGKRWSYLAERVDGVRLSGLKAADTEALDLGSFSQIKTLSLYECEMSNSTLSRLADLKKLKRLDIWYFRIEHPDLAFLEKLPALSDLTLFGDWAGQTGLEHVGRLKHLKYLNLGQAGIKDADLQQLQGLVSLEELRLQGNNDLSDAALEHLQGLKSLHVLYFDYWPRGSPGVAKLKQAIPGLQVHQR